MAFVRKENETAYFVDQDNAQEQDTIYTTAAGVRETMVGMKGNISYSVEDSSTGDGPIRIVIARRPNGSDLLNVATGLQPGEITDQMQNVVWSWTAVLHEGDRTSYTIPVDLKTQRKMYSGDSLVIYWAGYATTLKYHIAYNFNTFLLES